MMESETGGSPIRVGPITLRTSRAVSIIRPDNAWPFTRRSRTTLPSSFRIDGGTESLTFAFDSIGEPADVHRVGSTEESSVREFASKAAIDRISPTLRPPRPAIMRMNWRYLLFLHWPVPADQLRALIPPQLELDLFEGTAYVGLVPFTMTGVRPVGVPPVPGLSSFHETNVRTYVRLGDRDPGVWFFSLDAANGIAVKLARSLFHLPYHYARMLLEHELRSGPDSPLSILYAGVRRWPGPLPGSYAIRATPRGTVQPASAATLEHFLVERYLLYSIRKNQLYQGRVHHTPYPLQPAKLLSLDESLLAAVGLDRPTTTPIAHFSVGVNVQVFPLQRI